MFDRVIHAPTTVTGPRELKVNVKEERAPTDDSVRLLGEMQEKARKDIVAAIAVESNIMKGVVLSFGPDFNECGRTKVLPQVRSQWPRVCNHCGRAFNSWQ